MTVGAAVKGSSTAKVVAGLAAVGALRSGAGLVTVATPASCQAIVATMGPEYMTEALAELDGGIDPECTERVVDMARAVSRPEMPM